jgi:hypothetical protein
MTRQADPKATGYFSVKARNETEHQLIGDLKRLACQNQIELTDLIFEGIQHIFKTRQWSPLPQSNSSNNNQQTPPLPFSQQTEPSAIVEHCMCGRPAAVWATCIVTKKEHQFCPQCFSNVPLRFDPKTWQITKDQRKTTP